MRCSAALALSSRIPAGGRRISQVCNHRLQLTPATQMMSSTMVTTRSLQQCVDHQSRALRTNNRNHYQHSAFQKKMNSMDTIINLNQRRSFASSRSSNPVGEVLKMMQGLHSPGEVSFYLQQFKKFNGPAFAVIKVGGEVVDEELNVLCASCTLLHSVGLTPIVIHGGGPQMNKELERQGIKPEYVGGHRVTDENTLAVAVRIFTELNERVVKALNSMGTKAKGFPTGVFQAEMNRPELGFVGEITGVNVDGVLGALKAGEIPVLTSLGHSPKLNRPLNINADVAAREIAIKLKPMRVVFTSSKGGWIDDETKKLVPTIDLNREYERLVNRDYTGRQGTLLKLKEIKHLLDNLPRMSAVAITSASSITKELFTHSGGGTLFLKGEQIHRYDSIGAVDTGKLNILLDESSGGIITTPPKSDAYYETLQAALDAIYVSESYNACAIVTKRKQGDDTFYYLEKFSVEPAARGTGLDSALWAQLKQVYPSLAWKCKHWNDYDADLAQHADATLYDHSTDTIVAWYARSKPPVPQGIGRWDMEEAKTLLVPESLPSELILQEMKSKTGLGGKKPSKSLKATSADGTKPLADVLQVNESASSKISSWGPASKIVLATPSNLPRIKVGLIGARGYVGREFVKLLVQHPRLKLVLASSRALVGQPVIKAFGLPETTAESSIAKDLAFESVEPNMLDKHPLAADIDVWVLALPNGLAPAWIEPIKKVGRQANGMSGALMIDLGADFRFTDDWVYGFPERPGTREKLLGARKISNPGCYATGTQAALMPLLSGSTDTVVRADVSKGVPTVFGVSGYSGAGTTPSDKNNPVVLRDNLLAYSLVNHMHEREVTRHLKTQIAFMPHVASFFQGISLTLSVYLSPITPGGKDYPDAKMVLDHFKEYYSNEQLIRPVAGTPAVRDIMMHHHVNIGGFTVDPKTGRLAMVSVIDNLLKGAATQALQNVNIALGVNELDGIRLESKKKYA